MWILLGCCFSGLGSYPSSPDIPSALDIPYKVLLLIALFQLTSEGAKTMPLGIANLVSEYTQLWGIIGSSGFTFTIPMLLFSIFCQKYIVKGLTLGAVSG